MMQVIPLTSGQIFESLTSQAIPRDVDARQAGPFELHQSFDSLLAEIFIPYIKYYLLKSISSSSWVTYCDILSNISDLSFRAFF
jgi:hypothetical protein